MKYHFDILANDFTLAGKAAAEIKKTLKSLNIPTDVIKKVAIAMYEAEINMVVHAQGGTADVEITESEIIIVMSDSGPGISDLDKAMGEGFSTADTASMELGYGAGMGLSNIKRNTDTLLIDSIPGKGTTVTMRICYA